MSIYLDNAATTAVLPEASAVACDTMTNLYANPASLHTFGFEAEKLLEKSRETLAKAIGCKSEELFFTSGGTGSDNLAVLGYLKTKRGGRIITSAYEHPAVLECFKQAESKFDVVYLKPENGIITEEALQHELTPDTVLVSVMHVNNETGALNPTEKLARLTHLVKGAVFHTDAVQAVAHVAIDVKAMNIDMLSLSGHKFNAPKGVGALYIRKGITIPNLIDGGQQERGKRAGTENIPAIVGMGYAIEVATKELDERMGRVKKMRDRLRDELMRRIPYSKLNTPENSLPGTLNISFEYIEGESILLMLDMNGICASSGSACTSGSLDPSHVLLAIGLPHEVAHGSVRMSLDHNNTEEEVDHIINTLPKIIQRLRDMSPLWERVEDKKPCITD